MKEFSINKVFTIERIWSRGEEKRDYLTRDIKWAKKTIYPVQEELIKNDMWGKK